jgi:hypothetical protein
MSLGYSSAKVPPEVRLVAKARSDGNGSQSLGRHSHVQPISVLTAEAWGYINVQNASQGSWKLYGRIPCTTYSGPPSDLNLLVVTHHTRSLLVPIELRLFQQ